MRVDRLFHARRMVLCLGLVGMLGLTAGCAEDTTTQAPTTQEQKDKMNKFQGDYKAARAKAIKDAPRVRGDARGANAPAPSAAPEAEKKE
jgi:hypothetical protein